MTRGPRPKENAVRRNVHPHAQELTPDAQPGRELPRGLGITTSGAKRFWKTWSTSPQSAAWAETDWAELEITTRLVDALYQGDLRHAGEIRQRTGKWGATVEDRARLRMSIKDEHQDQDADQVPAETTTDLDEELFRLLSNS
ncbi:phage terminase small subunit [Kitasatospora purpeofusca]|uniref:phage terminase small subunit n=1 Tax=Kitasatospora purpeofusca TaxID=67352 RepID=UPI00365CF20E